MVTCTGFSCGSSLNNEAQSACAAESIKQRSFDLRGDDVGLNVLRGQTDIFGTKTCYDVAINVPLVGLTYKGRKRVMMWVCAAESIKQRSYWKDFKQTSSGAVDVPRIYSQAR